MTDLQALFTQYIEGNAKEQERAAKQIAQTNGAQAFLMEKLSGAQARAALALLGRAARRESVRWALMDKTQEIVPLLASEDAKTRKNAAWGRLASGLSCLPYAARFPRKPSSLCAPA